MSNTGDRQDPFAPIRRDEPEPLTAADVEDPQTDGTANRTQALEVASLIGSGALLPGTATPFLPRLAVTPEVVNNPMSRITNSDSGSALARFDRLASMRLPERTVDSVPNPPRQYTSTWDPRGDHRVDLDPDFNLSPLQRAMRMDNPIASDVAPAPFRSYGGLAIPGDANYVNPANPFSPNPQTDGGVIRIPGADLPIASPGPAPALDSPLIPFRDGPARFSGPSSDQPTVVQTEPVVVPPVVRPGDPQRTLSAEPGVQQVPQEFVAPLPILPGGGSGGSIRGIPVGWMTQQIAGQMIRVPPIPAVPPERFASKPPSAPFAQQLVVEAPQYTLNGGKIRFDLQPTDRAVDLNPVTRLTRPGDSDAVVPPVRLPGPATGGVVDQPPQLTRPLTSPIIRTGDEPSTSVRRDLNPGQIPATRLTDPVVLGRMTDQIVPGRRAIEPAPQITNLSVPRAGEPLRSDFRLVDTRGRLADPILASVARIDPPRGRADTGLAPFSAADNRFTDGSRRSITLTQAFAPIVSSRGGDLPVAINRSLVGPNPRSADTITLPARLNVQPPGQPLRVGDLPAATRTAGLAVPGQPQTLRGEVSPTNRTGLAVPGQPQTLRGDVTPVNRTAGAVPGQPQTLRGDVTPINRTAGAVPGQPQTFRGDLTPVKSAAAAIPGQSQITRGDLVPTTNRTAGATPGQPLTFRGDLTPVKAAAAAIPGQPQTLRGDLPAITRAPGVVPAPSQTPRGEMAAATRPAGVIPPQSQILKGDLLPNSQPTVKGLGDGGKSFNPPTSATMLSGTEGARVKAVESNNGQPLKSTDIRDTRSAADAVRALIPGVKQLAGDDLRQTILASVPRINDVTRTFKPDSRTGDSIPTAALQPAQTAGKLDSLQWLPPGTTASGIDASRVLPAQFVIGSRTAEQSAVIPVIKPAGEQPGAIPLVTKGGERSLAPQPNGERSFTPPSVGERSVGERSLTPQTSGEQPATRDASAGRTGRGNVPDLQTTYLQVGNQIFILDRRLVIPGQDGKPAGETSDGSLQSFVMAGALLGARRLKRKKRKDGESDDQYNELQSDATGAEKDEEASSSTASSGEQLQRARLVSRHTYMVQPGDSLTDLAQAIWNDKDLGWLILEVNALDHRWQGDTCVVKLAARQTIEFPAPDEVEEFNKSGKRREHTSQQLLTIITYSQVDEELVQSASPAKV